MHPTEALVALNMVEHVGPIRLRQLMAHFESPVDVLRATRSQLLSVQGIGEETADAITRWERDVDLAGELKRVEQYGCRIVTQLDPEYPPLLREIYDPPIVLYVNGSLLPTDKNSLSVVGARQTTPYGTETARRIAYQLGYAGITVVSGGARGIDTAAHLGALAAGGRTIAVLGTGINIVFPSHNAELFQRIAENGAVITQFPFNRPADKQSFPIRNRIVAGISLGTLVVEANIHSGARITAHFATDYGRLVFAVPGRIDSPRSKGCHELIKNGAKLCEGIEDILPEFEYIFPPINRPSNTTADRTHLNRDSDSDPDPELELTDETPANTDVPLPLSPDESGLIEVLGDETLPLDDIIRALKKPAQTVQTVLFDLEMKRVIQQLPGKQFRRTPQAVR